MAEFCIECERLWREYSAAFHEHLGLKRPAGLFPDRGVVPWTGPKPESRTALVVMRERISKHEGAAHPESM
jgi:hypothetical protein